MRKEFEAWAQEAWNNHNPSSQLIQRATTYEYGYVNGFARCKQEVHKLIEHMMDEMGDSGQFAVHKAVLQQINGAIPYLGEKPVK